MGWRQERYNSTKKLNTPTYIIYNITITSNKVTIEFDNLADIYLILVFLDFYKNDKYCIIKKILLSTNRVGIKWFNDITSYKKKPLIFLVLKLRDEWVDNSNSGSNIFNTETNNSYSLEILTVNENNNMPVTISKRQLYEKLLKEIMYDL